jgi:hypothetical protein
MARTIATSRLLDKLDSAIARLVKVAERTGALAQRDGTITERQADQREAAEREVNQLIADIRERLGTSETGSTDRTIARSGSIRG